jgi:hypothetical protein
MKTLTIKPKPDQGVYSNSHLGCCFYHIIIEALVVAIAIYPDVAGFLRVSHPCECINHLTTRRAVRYLGKGEVKMKLSK